MFDVDIEALLERTRALFYGQEFRVIELYVQSLNV